MLINYAVSINAEWTTERGRKGICLQRLCRFYDVKLVDSFV